MKKSILTTILLAAFVIIFQVSETKAAPGDPDPTFPANSVTFPIWDDYYGLVMNRIEVLSDGKYLVAGYAKYHTPDPDRLILRRHNADGSLDTSFGRYGDVVEYIGMGQYRRIKMSKPTRIAVQPDGKILIGGIRHSDDGLDLGLSVWRFTADGFLDETFDGDGRKDFTDWVSHSPNTKPNVEAVKILKPDGLSLEQPKIYVLCTYNNIHDYGIEDDLADSSELIRLNLDGSSDTSFGSHGKALFSGEFNDFAFYKPSSQASESIYLAGISGSDFTEIGGGNKLTVWRYTKDGFPDTTFAANGRSSLPIDYYIRRFERVLIQKDGKLLVSGDLNRAYGIIERYIMRMNSNGVFEQQFGDRTISGVGAIANAGGLNVSIAQQSDGKFILGSPTKRYFRDGTVDESYVADSNAGVIYHFTIQKDNKLVHIGGYWENGGTRGYRIFRHLP